jgi:predicted SAM-dependent methyltransferase
MLLSLVRGLIRRRAGKRDDSPERSAHALVTGPIKLHIGGQIRHPDWKILDVRPGPIVDYLGHCTDLSEFDDESVSEIYASHVIEHLGYKHHIAMALAEFNRVLVPGGIVRISVPDLPTLCALYLDPTLNSENRYHVMRMMFGGQINEADFHYVGLNEELLTSYLQNAGLADITRVGNFGLFDDSSNLVYNGKPISLNVSARKPLR